MPDTSLETDVAIAVISGRPSTLDAAAARLRSCGITELVECYTWIELPSVMQRRDVRLVAADVEICHFESAAPFLRPEQVLWFAGTETLNRSVLLTSDPLERWRDELEQLLSGPAADNAAIECLPSQPTCEHKSQRLPLKLRGGGVKVVESATIVFALSSLHGCDVYISNKEIVPAYQSLSEIELMLAARSGSRRKRTRVDFARAGRVLVNLDFVAAVTVKRNEYSVQFTSGASVALSRKSAVLISSSVMRYWGFSHLQEMYQPRSLDR